MAPQHNMRRLIAVLAVTVMATVGLPTPAGAAHVFGVVHGHWGKFRWGGYEAHGRMFFVYDRTGDHVVGEVMKEFIGDFVADAQARGVWGQVPHMHYVHDPHNAGACGDFSSLVPYSFITVCSTRYEPRAVVETGNVEHRYGEDTFHPRVYMTLGMDYNLTYSFVGHELTHALGVNHSPSCHHLMRGGEFGCSFDSGEKAYLTDADWKVLTDFYTRHFW